MFTRAIVRKPTATMTMGLTSADLGLPDFEKACEQHENYVAALKSCGLKVQVLDADPDYPDSTFVEDTALLTSSCAIITNPGAPSRKGEIRSMESVLKSFYADIEHIRDPGTLEAGDVMMVGAHFYIGLSQRTNEEGAQQLIDILERHGLGGSVIPLKKVLHLKTGVAYLEHNIVAVCGEFVEHPAFKDYRHIQIPAAEAYAANCIWVNETIIVPAGFPLACERIEDAGYRTLAVDVSEFRKLDGGLSCLSLRF